MAQTSRTVRFAVGCFSEAHLTTADLTRNVTVACIHRMISGVTLSHSDLILFCSCITYGSSVKTDRPRMASEIKINELHEKTKSLTRPNFHGNFYTQKDYISVGRDF
jgi:hypothetical protein